MNNIDYIYYTATTTDQFGESVTVATYFIPFLDFILVFLVLVFSIISILVVDYFCYKKDIVVKLKNSIRISKKNLWN